MDMRSEEQEQPYLSLWAYVFISLLCVWRKALVKQRQVEDELARLQDALTKVINEAGARTRQEVLCLLTYSIDFHLSYKQVLKFIKPSVI